jgi:hypothetical protein
MYLVDKHQKGEGKGMRWIININKENLDLVKVFLKAGIQTRHVKICHQRILVLQR